MKDKHCSHCGSEYTKQEWPRHCGVCNEMTWRNPLPVGIALLPVDDGVLLIRRGEDPKKGCLAFPGGFLEFDETWAQGIAREVREEVGISILASEVKLFDLLSSDTNMLVVAGLGPRIERAALASFQPNNEVTELVVVNQPIELVFETHKAILAKFFKR